MKIQVILCSAILVLSSVGCYYYGASNGVEAGASVTTFTFAKHATTQMRKHAMLLETVKNGDMESVEKIALALVEHDMEHLDGIEQMLLAMPDYQQSEIFIQSTLQQTKAMHKELSRLR